jgi:hypothetical protein
MSVQILVGCMWYEADEGFLLKRRGKGRLKQYEDVDGYMRYVITDKYKKKYNLLVHRIVWQFFHGPIPEGMTVDHIDGNKHNNFITNLQLLTPEENAIKGNARNWLVSNPDGEEFEVYNLEQYCRENNLHAGHLREVSKGKLLQYKGWKCYERK